MSKKSEPKLLSSGNPQILKAEGNAPVQTCIAAMPGCKSGIGRCVGHIAEHAFPDVQKAVKWNTSLLGKEDGYFIEMYCYKKYVQLTFMQGTSLKPVPPVASKIDGTRYFNIYEDDEFDEVQIEEWAAQAIKLPGEKL